LKELPEMIEINNTNALIIKSFEFAIDVVNLARYLQTEKNEYVISKQVLRSGTSIGANFTLLNCFAEYINNYELSLFNRVKIC
jgi:hypothetical protein